MTAKNHKPIRMCVVCKGRFFQRELLRFAFNGKKIVLNPKNLRSFYLCQNCVKKGEEGLKKPLSRFCKSINLKEFCVWQILEFTK